MVSERARFMGHFAGRPDRAFAEDEGGVGEASVREEWCATAAVGNSRPGRIL
jgi:hypothetical protein